jgi:UDP-glucose 4-epimerase
MVKTEIISLINKFYENKRILITGASGYIAWNLVKHLMDFNCEIICLSRTGSQVDKHIGKANCSFHYGDYNNINFLEKSIKNIDIIFHLASQTSIYEAEKNPVLDYESNVKPMQLILECCRKERIPPTIIFSGTSTQCGIPKKVPVNERVIDRPITTYDFHKLQAERWLKFYSKQGWAKGVSFRLTNVFGPGPKSSSSDRGILNLMIKKALKNEPLTIYGDGNCIRDYIYIDDVISAFISSPLFINRMKHKHFLLGSGKGTKIKDAVKEVAKNVNKEALIKHINAPERMSLIETRNFIADTTKLNNITGWVPNYNIIDGIDLTVKQINMQ